jgi:hypothetical protein
MESALQLNMATTHCNALPVAVGLQVCDVMVVTVERSEVKLKLRTIQTLTEDPHHHMRIFNFRVSDLSFCALDSYLNIIVFKLRQFSAHTLSTIIKPIHIIYSQELIIVL